MCCFTQQFIDDQDLVYRCDICKSFLIRKDALYLFRLRGNDVQVPQSVFTDVFNMLKRCGDVLEEFFLSFSRTFVIGNLLSCLGNAKIVRNAEGFTQAVEPIDHRRHRVANIVHHFGGRIRLTGLERLFEQCLPCFMNLSRHGVELPCE